MSTSESALRAHARYACSGRVARGSIVVLASALVLPTALWLIALVAVMASRPRNPVRPAMPRISLPQPALRTWIGVSLLFVLAAMLTMLRKPITGHGIELIGWFSLLPAIGIAFGVGGRRAYTTMALWAGATVGACGAGLMALFEVVLLDRPRAEGLVANAITFGNLALLMGALSIALHKLVPLSRHATLPASACAGVLGLMASILSGSRGGWLALPFLVAVLLWQHRAELTAPALAQIGVIFVLALAVLNTLADGMPTSRATASVTNVSGYSESGKPQAVMMVEAAAGSSEGARIEAWRSAGTAFRERPISGIGWGNLAARFDLDAELGIRHERIATFDHAHNQLLGAAASGGLIGVAALIALLAVPLRGFAVAAWSNDVRRRGLGASGVIVLGSFAVFGLTESVLENLVPITVFAVLIAALCAELDAAHRGDAPPDISTATVALDERGASAWARRRFSAVMPGPSAHRADSFPAGHLANGGHTTDRRG